MQCELSDEACSVLTSLVYKAWSQAFDTLKQANKEKDDGSEDWELFHAERVRRAKIEQEKYARVLNEIKKYDPLLRI